MLSRSLLRDRRRIQSPAAHLQDFNLREKMKSKERNRPIANPLDEKVRKQK
jgi:hypothetical protein